MIIQVLVADVMRWTSMQSNLPFGVSSPVVSIRKWSYPERGAGFLLSVGLLLGFRYFCTCFTLQVMSKTLRRGSIS